MKKTILVVSLLILSAAATARAQAGYIGVFSDPIYTDCSLTDTGPGIVTVWVVHKATSGATGSQFMIQDARGFALVYLAETPQFLTVIGNTQTGIAMGYGGCLASDISLVAILYQTIGTSPTCACLQPVPDPAAPSGSIEVTDCTIFPNKLVGGASAMWVNQDVGICGCGLPSIPCIAPVAVTHSTWGSVKALYR